MRLSSVSAQPFVRRRDAPIISRLRDTISADVGRLRSREHAFRMAAHHDATAYQAAAPFADEAAGETAVKTPAENDLAVKAAFPAAAKPKAGAKRPAVRKRMTVKAPKAAKPSARSKAARTPRAKAATAAQNSKRRATRAAASKPAKSQPAGGGEKKS